MLEKLKILLSEAINQVHQLRIVLGIVGIAAGMAIAAIVLKDHLSNLGGVVVAINMGILLMFSVLMFVAAAKAKGKAVRPYQKLYFIIICILSFILLISAILSLTSVFWGVPLNFNELSDGNPIIETYTGDYRIEESVVYFDLSKRVRVLDSINIESKVFKHRLDRVVRQRITDFDYQMQSGTNGKRIEGINSPSHYSMETKEAQSERFILSTKKTYIHEIAADRFPIGEIIDVKLNAVFINSFCNEEEEWLGVCPNVDTKQITIIVQFPENKRCKSVLAMEQPTGNSEVEFRGNTKPVIHNNGKLVSWTILKPAKGVGYFISFKW